MSKTVVLSDWDNTLFTFRHSNALSAISWSLERDCGLRDARQITAYAEWLYREISDYLDYGKQHLIITFLKRKIRELGCTEEAQGVFLSRELWLKTAFHSYLLKTSDKTILRAANVYWDTIEYLAWPYIEVPSVLRELKRRDIPLCIVTASDGRLRLTPHGFRYDPGFTQRKKQERMRKTVRRTLHMPWKWSRVFIADPWGKRQVQFWEKIRADPLVRSATRVIVVGDSYLNDIAPAAHCGFTTILIDRDGKVSRSETPLATRVTRDLSLLLELI